MLNVSDADQADAKRRKDVSFRFRHDGHRTIHLDTRSSGTRILEAECSEEAAGIVTVDAKLNWAGEVLIGRTTEINGLRRRSRGNRKRTADVARKAIETRPDHAGRRSIAIALDVVLNIRETHFEARIGSNRERVIIICSGRGAGRPTIRIDGVRRKREKRKDAGTTTDGRRCKIGCNS